MLSSFCRLEVEAWDVTSPFFAVLEVDATVTGADAYCLGSVLRAEAAAWSPPAVSMLAVLLLFCRARLFASSWVCLDFERLRFSVITRLIILRPSTLL